MEKSKLAKKVYDVSHLTGEYKLRSGQISKEYFDKYLFESNPEILNEITKNLKLLIPKDTEILAGLEMGGIPIVTALSLETLIPAVFVRKEAKEYGTCKLAEGISIKGKKVCIIEDVVTTGGQIILSTNDLRERGAIVENVVCVIDRNPGKKEKIKQNDLKLYSLFTMEDLIS